MALDRNGRSRSLGPSRPTRPHRSCGRRGCPREERAQSEEGAVQRIGDLELAVVLHLLLERALHHLVVALPVLTFTRLTELRSASRIRRLSRPWILRPPCQAISSHRGGETNTSRRHTCRSLHRAGERVALHVEQRADHDKHAACSEHALDATCHGNPLSRTSSHGHKTDADWSDIGSAPVRPRKDRRVGKKRSSRSLVHPSAG